MDITLINEENQSYFEALILPDLYKLLAKGLPLTAIGLVDNETACGALVGYQEDSTFRIASLFIAPAYRNRGGGKLLLSTIKEVLSDVPTVFRMQTSYTVTEKDHEVLHAFLSHMGFQPQTPQETIYHTTLGALQHTPFFSGPIGNATPADLIPFSKIPDIWIKQLDRRLSADGGRLFEDSLEQTKLDRDISVGFVSENQIVAFLLFDHSFGGMLTFAYADSGAGKKSSERFPVMLRHAFRLAAEKYPPNTPIVIQATTPLSAALVRRITQVDTNCKVISHVMELDITDMSKYGPLFQN